ncbi:MAG: type I secretion system permease/ATPase [Novosphingobium sp.]
MSRFRAMFGSDSSRFSARERELIRRFLARYRDKVSIILIASLALNLLVFAGSVYLLMIYDSVLPSRSFPTLFSLFGLLILLYLFQLFFEIIRGEALLRAANGIHSDLWEAVHFATVTRVHKTGRRDGDGLQVNRDLDQVQAFLSGQGPVALIDLPWLVLFLLVLTLLHWSLGLTALLGAIILAGIALASSRNSATGTRDLASVTGRRIAANQAELRFADSARSMGMQGRLLKKSADLNQSYIEAQSFLSRTVARFGGAGKTFRLFLQSAMLTVGAFLVINDQATGGIIIAASVLTGRALAPVDLAIANWRGLSAACGGWSRIVEAIDEYRMPLESRVSLDPPSGTLSVNSVWITPPGGDTFIIKGVNFSLEPGQALAIIGPSAAGKTTLAKALLNIWQPTRGEVRIDGARHDQWQPEVIGAALGYVPQVVELIEGSIGENIARFDKDASSQAIIAAAKAAGLHEAILALPKGYDTHVSAGGVELSAGQRQRVGLATALFGDPHVIVLDEPSSNLDAEGDAALANAISGVRARRGIVVMITHRPATLAPVSHIAILKEGQLTEFGERDDILKRLAGGKGNDSVRKAQIEAEASAS